MGMADASKFYTKPEEAKDFVARTGVVPAKRLDSLLDRLANDKTLVPVTLSHSVYKYDALMLRPQTYGRFIKEEIGRVLDGMLYRDATNFWKTELEPTVFIKPVVF